MLFHKTFFTLWNYLINFVYPFIKGEKESLHHFELLPYFVEADKQNCDVDIQLCNYALFLN